MIAYENILKSINRLLYNNIEVAEGVKIAEATQDEIVRSDLDSGNPVVFFQVSNELEGSENHPKFRLICNVVMLKSSNAIIRVNEILSKLVESLFPGSSFSLYDYSGGTEVYLTEAVSIKKLIGNYHIDNDRFIVQPVTFRIGYGNIFN